MDVHLSCICFDSRQRRWRNQENCGQGHSTIRKLGSLCVVVVVVVVIGSGEIVKCEVFYFMSMGLDCAVIANPFHGPFYVPHLSFFSLLNANMACKNVYKIVFLSFYSFFFFRFDCVIHDLLLFHRLINQMIERESEWAPSWLWKTHRIPENAWNQFSYTFTIHF